MCKSVMNIEALSQNLFHDTKVYTLAEDETSQIIQVQNDTGDGLMSSYMVFPGVYLMFNDFHMEQCESQFQAEVDMLCIDHCREGRIEQEIKNGAYIYLGAGDLCVDRRMNSGRHVEFPLGHYHGVSISFVLKDANEGINSYIKDFPVDIARLKKKYCDGRINLVLQNEQGLEGILADLYAVPAQIRLPYFRVKIQELLLYLDALEIPATQMERPYFFKTQVEKTKAIHTLMTNNMEQHFTLQELSERFDFPMTAMKNCFKNIYGDSIFSYMRVYRINQAAVLLRRNREKSVLEIAAQMGYDSPGKFSTAFKKIMGVSPLTYRKSSVGLDKKHPDGKERN